MNIKIKHILAITTALLFGFISGPAAFAGPYNNATNPNYPVDDIDMSDGRIVAWATGWQDYNAGDEVDAQWQTPGLAIGEAAGTSYDIVSLGRGGSITLAFDAPIVNGAGADFAVFENSFDPEFLELAWVEVSTDGINFVRFDNNSLTQNPVPGFGKVDFSNLYQLAGKYKQGTGTLFDLDMLQYNVGNDPSNVDVNDIHYIRLIDIVGDGSYLDTWGNIIYDPYPTTGSAGFDLDAIGVLNQGTSPIPGDFFNDSDVDGSDLEEFINFYVNNSYPEADLTGDGVIDFEDLMMFAENFGRTKK